MGLRPVLGRLLNDGDDGPAAAGAVVLTHRFWTTWLDSDPTVIDKTIRLGPGTGDGRRRPRTIRALPGGDPDHRERRYQPAPSRGDDGYRPQAPDDGAVRPAGPDATLEAARSELISVHASMMDAHPEAYSRGAHVQLQVRRLGDQLASPARTILLVLLAAAAVVFVIACLNIANLILAPVGPP